MWTPGTIAAAILIPTGTILLLIAALLSWIALHKGGTSRYDDDPFSWWLGACITAIFGIPMLALPLIGMGLVGFNPDYMHYKPVTGTVQAVASRQISDGQSMSTRYVFQINGQAYGVDDTRAALTKPGDLVALNCMKEFVWGSTANGWACNWG